MPSSTVPKWQQTVTEKLRIRNEAVRKYSDSRQSQTSTTNGPAVATAGIDQVDDVLQAISSGTVTAAELCDAYIGRAIKAHERVTAPLLIVNIHLADWHRRTGTFTEIIFDDALKRAQSLDQFFKENGRLVGPLHGVPMTLKDQFDVEGYDSTLGYVGRAFRPAAQDCVLVALLKQMGAVIIAKSNLPQSIMWCETDNPLWGLTTHPRNPDFTPGGSTGGEGTLLNLHGSVVGWGTDIGGSIRIPSHMLGLYGLKPSSTRLPYHDVSVSTEGQEHIPSVIGPMTRNLASLVSVTKAVISSKPWDLDPKCCPIPWRTEMFAEVQSRPLVIAVMRDDGVVKPHPPISRVLEEVATKLQNAGHELVEWAPGKLHQECIDIMDQYYTADGGEDIKRDIAAGGEPFISHVEALVNKGQAISVYEYWQLNKQKLAAQKRYLDLWNSTNSPTSGKRIDILLTPVMPHSSVPHRKCRWVGYTKVFNVVDYPAVVIPAGAVSKELDCRTAAQMAAHKPRNPIDEWNWGNFDVDSMDGMPIGVQVVARRLEEEKVLGAAQIIDNVLRGVSTP